MQESVSVDLVDVPQSLLDVHALWPNRLRILGLKKVSKLNVFGLQVNLQLGSRCQIGFCLFFVAGAFLQFFYGQGSRGLRPFRSGLLRSFDFLLLIIQVPHLRLEQHRLLLLLAQRGNALGLRTLLFQLPHLVDAVNYLGLRLLLLLVQDLDCCRVKTIVVLLELHLVVD